jgi:hypothetical protein
VEADEAFAVTLANVIPLAAGVDAAHIDATDTATVTIANDDRGVLLVSVAEDEGTASVLVTLDQAVDGGFSIDYTLPGGTADAGDYTPTGGTLNFTGTAGEQQAIHVPITVDEIVEADETFSVLLSNVVPAAPGIDPLDVNTTASVNVTIVNDDVAVLRVPDVVVDETAGTAEVAVRLEGAVQGGFSVNYSLPGGTADAGDYMPTGGTLIFAGTEGETQTISVPITLDAIVEADDTFDLLHTLAVTFNEDVNVQAAALSLRNDTAGGTPVNLTGILFNYDGATLTASWDFSSVAGLGAAFYTVVLDATLVTNSIGDPLDGDGDGTGGDDFDHALLVAKRGDSDTDGDVDLSDYNRLATNFDPVGFAGPHSWADGNFDSDNDVDLSDYNNLAANFNPAGYLGATLASLPEPDDFEDGNRTSGAMRLAEKTGPAASTSPLRWLPKSRGAGERSDLQPGTTAFRSARREAISAAFAQYEHDRQSFGTVASSVTGARSLNLTLAEQLNQRESERVRNLFAK